MASKKGTISRRVQSKPPVSIWQAMNEPIATPTEEFGKNVFFFAALIMLAAWVTPYWQTAQAMSVEGIGYSEGVAGARFETLSPTPYTLPDSVPAWYFTVSEATQDVKGAFISAASETLDFSESAQNAVEFYRPGVSAVWNAWLDLMADPY